MDLIVCEKASAARDFASALGAKWDTNTSSYSNDSYRIIALQGHVVSLRGLSDYDNAFQGKWGRELLPKLPVIPDLNDRHMYTVSNAKLFKNAKQHLLDPVIETVINAADAGREGELLFWEVYRLAGSKKPVRRFWESDALSKEVVLRGLNNLRDESFYGPRRAAAYARQHADWYLGMNLTVAYSAATGQFYSVGPVQTPVLAMIVSRDELIAAWKPIPYDEIEVDFDGFTAKFRPTFPKYPDRQYSVDPTDSNEFLAYFLKFTKGIVHAVRSESKQVIPPKLLSLTRLQIEANKKYGFSASTTLKIAQKLYDDPDYKCLSYPRTDSEVVGSSMIGQVTSLLESLRKHYDVPFTSPVFTDRNVNDAELTDHHALIPLRPLPEGASESERKIYRLVLERFFQAFGNNGLDNTYLITLKVGDKDFEAKETVRAEAGWRQFKLAAESETDSKAGKVISSLITLREGQSIAFKEPPKVIHKTIDAPSHYTEASLLEAMSNVANTINDEELRQAMKSVDGRLGTPATQDSIIDLLQQRGYVEKQKKSLVATTIGKALIHTVGAELKNAVQRARMEQLLNDFNNSKATEQYLQDIHKLIVSNVEYCRNLRDEDLTLPTIDATCPVCGGGLVSRGYRYTCASGSCTFSLPKTYNGHQLKITEIQALVTRGETDVLTFTKKDSSGQYQAKLKLNQEHSIELSFAKPEDLRLGQCPKCKSGMVYSKSPKVCVCNACDFVLFRVVAQKALTDKQIQALLTKGALPVVKGFKKSDNSTFAAGLKFDSNFKLTFTKAN